MSKSDSLEIEGEIVQVQPGDFFQVKVKLGENDHLIRAKISGRLRKNKIKLILGDKVTVKCVDASKIEGTIDFELEEVKNNEEKN